MVAAASEASTPMANPGSIPETPVPGPETPGPETPDSPQIPEPGPGPEIPGGTPAEAPSTTPTEIPVESPGLPDSTPTGPANPTA